MKAITKSQARAIEYLQTSDRLLGYGDIITKFGIRFTDYGAVWVSVDIEAEGAEPGSLLYALSYDHWFIQIGPRGRLTAFSYPDRCKQFAGKRSRGINFKR